jgi:hypothetical protein
MRIGITGVLFASIGLICSAQEPVAPVVKEHTDEPIRADDPRAIQAHAEIQTLIFGNIERWNAHDIDGFMEGAWKSKDFVMVVDAQEIRGWAEAVAAYHRGYADPNSMGNVVCQGLETQLITPEVALVVMRWTLYLKGGKVLGTSSIVARKFVDGWKVVSDHSTTLEP